MYTMLLLQWDYWRNFICTFTMKSKTYPRFIPELPICTSESVFSFAACECFWFWSPFWAPCECDARKKLLMASSFSSIKCIKLWMVWVQLVLVEMGDGVTASERRWCRWYRIYWRISLRRNTKSAAKEMIPQSKYKPQKLIKWSSSGDDFPPRCPGQPNLQNHKSCISWSLPPSESLKIAVDISTASRDSRWKACTHNKEKIGKMGEITLKNKMFKN